MSDHYSIRPSFILAYFQRHEDAWQRKMAINAEAEIEHKALNREFGLSDDPGSPYHTVHNEVGGEYKVRDIEISARARENYWAVSNAAIAQDRADGMSIYEFLLLDNPSKEAEQAMCVAAEGGQYSGFIGVRAEAEVRQLFDVGDIGHVEKNIEHRLVGHFHYAGRRCRKFFRLQLWNISALIAIHKFKKEYRECLWAAFKSTRTGRL